MTAGFGGTRQPGFLTFFPGTLTRTEPAVETVSFADLVDALTLNANVSVPSFDPIWTGAAASLDGGGAGGAFNREHDETTMHMMTSATTTNLDRTSSPQHRTSLQAHDEVLGHRMT